QGTPTDVIDGRQVNARPIWSVRWRVSVHETHRQTFRENGLDWAPIRSQEHVSEEPCDVFNISVEEDESYIVEGVVVHNCRHFSKAKGGRPVNKRVRSLAWVAVRWAREVRPECIVLENVEELVSWG